MNSPTPTAAIQMTRNASDPEGNVSRALDLTRQAIERHHARLIVLPEAVKAYRVAGRTDLAETIPGPTVERFMELSADAQSVIVVGLIEREGERLYNSAAVLDGGRCVGVCRKTHLHTSDVTDDHEPNVFTPGDRLGLFDTSIGRVGVMICHDGAYVEVPRVLVLEGADVLAWPMSSQRHGGFKERFYAETNLVPIVTANICHGEGLGNSSIVDDAGEVLALARGPNEVVSASVDLEGLASKRGKGFGREAVLRMRRPELYRRLLDPPRE